MIIKGRAAGASNLFRAPRDEKPVCGCLIMEKYKEIGR